MEGRLNPYLSEIVKAVKLTAEEEILPRYLKVARQHKSDGSLFTEADLAAQTALVSRLRAIAALPVLGEEMTPEAQSQLWSDGKQGLWCVDPIDGTTNFVNGIPYFAVSVALMHEGRPTLGVIFDPITQELFYAEQGKGAYLNGERLPIKRHVPSLRRAMAGIEFKRIDKTLAGRLANQAPYCSQRNFGASTLDWCYVAAGRFDIYLHGGQRLWDYAAGSLILQEAGGLMCTLQQDDFWADDIWQRSVVAALNPDLFRQWKAWLAQHSALSDVTN